MKKSYYENFTKKELEEEISKINKNLANIYSNIASNGREIELLEQDMESFRQSKGHHKMYDDDEIDMIIKNIELCIEGLRNKNAYYNYANCCLVKRLEFVNNLLLKRK